MNNKVKESNKNKSLLILTGFSCNNNCVICSVKEMKNSYSDRSFDDIIKNLEEGRKNDYKDVEFTGGETTIRPDIIRLVQEAKQLGFSTIALSTNGRLFSYDEFCRKIIEAGLNKITFSLLGHTEAIHNAIARTPGSFKEIIQGINNVQKFPHVHLNVSSVISRLNAKELKEFGLFILSLGVKHWYLLDLIPDGNARQMYLSLAVSPKKLESELNSLISIAPEFAEIGFFDFPLCLFQERFFKLPNAKFINAQRRLETSLQVGYNPSRTRLNSKGVYEDFYKRHIRTCQKCRFYKECGGIWHSYLNLFSKGEFEKMAKQHKCLK